VLRAESANLNHRHGHALRPQNLAFGENLRILRLAARLAHPGGRPP
jgi:hypothetical protein